MEKVSLKIIIGMKKQLVLFSGLVLVSMGAVANPGYPCTVTLTHRDCSVFCGSQAEDEAKECALLDCAEKTGKECEVISSTNWDYVTNYDAVKHFVGRAIAR
jgi:hypothetical protein